MSTVTMPKQTESTVLSFINENHAKRNTPEEIRQHQIRFLNKEWTIKDWKFLQSKYTAKELIMYFFDGDKVAFEFYKNHAEDKKKMIKFVDAGADPHHLDREELEMFYLDEGQERKSTVTDHYPENAFGGPKLGDRNLDYKIDLILMNQFQGFEFTGEGLQTFAWMHNHFIPIRKCEMHVKKVNVILRKIRFMDARRTGIVDMENEAVHEIKKYCKKNHVNEETTNAMILRTKRLVNQVNVNLGRNLGQAMIAKDKQGVLKKFAKALHNGADSLGLELNDVISQLVKESESG